MALVDIAKSRLHCTQVILDWLIQHRVGITGGLEFLAERVQAIAANEDINKLYEKFIFSVKIERPDSFLWVI